ARPAARRQRPHRLADARRRARRIPPPGRAERAAGRRRAAQVGLGARPAPGPGRAGPARGGPGVHRGRPPPGPRPQPPAPPAAPARAALAVLGVLGAFLAPFGGPPTAVAVLLIGDAPLAALSAYLATRRMRVARPVRALVAAAYGLLPPATAAVAQGRLDVV